MKYNITIILLLLNSFLLAQNGFYNNLNGKTFYNKTNTASNYFDAPVYEIDSIFVLTELSNDTIITWTTGISKPINSSELKRLENNNEFNVYFQKGITQKNGKTITHKMKPNYFKIKNDTIYELTELYSISQDSFEFLKKNKSMEEIIEITDAVTTKKFRPIFSPNFFNNNAIFITKETNNNCPNTIYLDKVWKTEHGKFYQFHIENKCGYWGHHWGYIVNEKYEIIRYGGYYSQENKYLTIDNLIFQRNE